MKRVHSRRVALPIEALEQRQLLTGAGDPNLAFGNGTGSFSQPASATPNFVEKVVVQPDGKILEIGHTTAGLGMLLRLNRDGSVDTGFGVNGTALFNFSTPLRGTEESLAYDAVVQVNGNITVVGTAIVHLSSGATGKGISSARFTSSGQLDATFTPFSDGFFTDLDLMGADIVVQNGTDSDVSNDRVVLIGYEFHREETDNDDMFAVRLLADGSVDKTFFNNSSTQPEDYIGFGANEYASAAVVENDSSSRNGDIIIVGTSVADDGTSKFAIARLRASDGKPDTSFSGDGKVLSAFVSEAQYNVANAVAVQADGSVVVAGTYSTTHKTHTDTHLGVFRLKPDGSGDSSFGVGNGQITLDANPNGVGMTLSQSGDILIDTLLSGHISISCLTAAGKLDTVFSSDGLQTALGVAGQYDGVGIATEPDGTFVAAAGQGLCTSSFYDRAKATVYIGSLDPTGSETGPDTMSFFVGQMEKLPAGTKVYFSVGGTASSPLSIPRTTVDYSGISSSILDQFVALPANSTSVTTTLTPIDDARPEADETVTITLVSRPGLYDVINPSTVTLTILDNDGQRVAGKIYNDANGNRKPDENQYFAGVTAYIDANNNGQFDSGERTAVTDSTGKYIFYSVPTGTQIIRQIPPTGYTQDDPVNKAAISVTVAAGQNYDLAPFGDTPAAPAPNGGKISGTVYNDANGNLTKDSGEVGIGSVTLYNDANNNSKFDAGEITTSTDTSGNYTFAGLAAGSYKIRQMLPPGYLQTTPTMNFGQTVTLTTNQVVTGKNFGDKVPSSGITKTGSITGFAFNDSNKDGKYDAGDSLAAGKTIWLDLDDDNVIDSNETKLTTASDGSFSFANLVAGTYHVRRSFPSGYAESTPAQYITLAAGQNVTGVAIGSKAT